jgi:Bacterial Ig-like domain
VAQEWSPLPNSVGAPINTPIRITFSDYPDPRTLGLASLVLTTGVFYYTGAYSVDLVGKAVVFQPASTLRPDIGYSITVLPALQSLSGCPAIYQQRAFSTGATARVPAPRPPVTFADVQPIFAARCGGAGCHREDPAAGGGCLATPAEGLSLCDGDAVRAMVGVSSRQVSDIALVQPHDSASSYLLRKLLSGPSGPAPGALGHRDPPGAPLSDDDLAAIAGWIDGGAR